MNLGLHLPKSPKQPRVCCGNPNDLDDSAHPWELLGENKYGDDVYGCPECGAEVSD